VNAPARPPWLTVAADGAFILTIFAKPRASRSKVAGEREGALAIQLAAPPVDGAANEELVAFLSKALGVPRRQVTLLSGDTNRHKRVAVTGVDEAGVLEALSG